MNLSPQRVEVLEKAGHNAKHWQSIGQGNETDRELMAWALCEEELLKGALISID